MNENSNHCYLYIWYDLNKFDDIFDDILTYCLCYLFDVSDCLTHILVPLLIDHFYFPFLNNRTINPLQGYSKINPQLIILEQAGSCISRSWIFKMFNSTICTRNKIVIYSLSKIWI